MDQEIGLFCGTFNPIHLGHLLIAECARDQFKLDHSHFCHQPHAPRTAPAAFCPDGTGMPWWKRQSQATKILSHRPSNSSEKDLPTQSTRSSKSANSIMLQDQCAHQFDHRRRQCALSQRMASCQRAHLTLPSSGGAPSCVMSKTWPRKAMSSKRSPRPRVPNMSRSQAATELHADIQVVDFPGIAISATMIRKRVEAGQSVLYMVPPAVAKIIAEKNIFCQNRSCPSAK